MTTTTQAVAAMNRIGMRGLKRRRVENDRPLHLAAHTRRRTPYMGVQGAMRQLRRTNVPDGPAGGVFGRDASPSKARSRISRSAEAPPADEGRMSSLTEPLSPQATTRAGLVR